MTQTPEPEPRIAEIAFRRLGKAGENARTVASNTVQTFVGAKARLSHQQTLVTLFDDVFGTGENVRDSVRSRHRIIGQRARDLVCLEYAALLGFVMPPVFGASWRSGKQK